jgi:hypothetical protein
MADMTQIITASMRLRGSSPEAWEQFVMAMREFSAKTAMEMIKCPPESLVRAQGMALMANELTTTIMDAPKLYEKMQARK